MMQPSTASEGAVRGNKLGSYSRWTSLAFALFAAWVPAVAATNGSSQTSPAAPRPAIALDAQSHSILIESQAMWRGETFAALTERWWQWRESIPSGTGFSGDPNGADCGINQEGPVWFLAAPAGVTFNSDCTVPAGKAILSPLFVVNDDYPCPPAFKFGPAPGQSLEAFLQADIALLVDDPAASTTATLDNKPLHVRHVKTSLFAFTAAPSNSTGDSCLTGSPQLGVSDGYFVFIDPLPPGQHILHLRSMVFTTLTDVTITLTVM